jgi:leader peptidase (prepilin peptidase)/N-methyltransferase
MEALTGFYVALVGAMIGSFLNVVIYRYPRGESIVFPASHCPTCGHVIAPWDNIPILSYILLGGRCRSCRSTISPRYPLVELTNCLFYFAVWQRLGVSIAAFLVAALVSMTLVLIYIDLDIQILPDVIDVPGIVIGVLLAVLAGGSGGGLTLAGSVAESLIGAAAGAALLLAIALGYKLVRRVEGMGLGDVKMIAMIGAALGYRALFAIVLLASVGGTLVGLTIAAVARKADLQFALPFGVFLGLAFLTILFFGREIYATLPALAFNV